MESGLYKILLMIWKLTSSGKKNPGSCFLFLIFFDSRPWSDGICAKTGIWYKVV